MGMFAVEWGYETWQVLADSGPWLLLGFVVAGAIHVAVPTSWVASHLGDRGAAGVFKAALIGAPLPLCSCSVIPVASAVRRQGAGRGATVSFLISTPETGVDSIAISYALLGPVLAVARLLAALLTAVGAGLAVLWISGREQAAERGRGDGAQSACTAPCGCSAETVGRPSRVREALHFGLIEMFVDLSHWLLAGFVLAGLLAAIVPEGFFERHVGAGAGAIVLMVAVGLPLYVCATSSTPVAAALMAAGLSPGAVLVFLLVGPATNLTTMLVVGRDLGRVSLVVYLSCIVLIAVGAGSTLDAFLPATPDAAIGISAATSGPAGPVAVAAGVILALLMLNGLRLRFFSHGRRERAVDTEHGA